MNYEMTIHNGQYNLYHNQQLIETGPYNKHRIIDLVNEWVETKHWVATRIKEATGAHYRIDMY